MNRFIAVAAAATLAAAGAATLADAGVKAPAAGITTLDALGKKKTVPPGNKDGRITSKDFSKAFAYCPRGYLATGGGVYSGAVTEIASAPTTDRKGWFVDGFNPSKDKAFQHRVAVVCAKGRNTTRAAAATAATVTDSQVRQLEADYAAVHQGTGR
jgi:hypothetical protein